MFNKKDKLLNDYEHLKIKYEVLQDEYNSLLNEVNELKLVKRNLQINKEVTDKTEMSTVEQDPLYDEILYFVMSSEETSVSMIQRKFSIGYNRAARIVDYLEEKNVVGPANGSKPREVLIRNK